MGRKTASAPERAGKRMQVRDRDALVLDHIDVMKYVVNRISAHLPSHVDREDLIQAGLLGLLDAAEKYEPERGIKFGTYAEQRVRGAVLDYLRKIDWVPRNVRKRAREIQRIYAELEQQHGRPATDSEMSEALGVTTDEFHKLLDHLKGTDLATLTPGAHAAIREAQDAQMVRYSPEAGDDSSPGVLLERSELRRILGEAIDDLPPNEKLVVSLYYSDELTMKEIAMVLDVNESRISQLHTKAMLRLRGKLQSILARRDAT
ncbi:MAG: FliA/WhiG family RNA polymerase sigma factor [Acidobacteriota bacterium]